MTVIQASKTESEPADRGVWVSILVWLDYRKFMRFPIWGSSSQHTGLCSHLFINNNNVTNQYHGVWWWSFPLVWLGCYAPEITHLKDGPRKIFNFFADCDSCCWLNLRIKSVDLWMWLWAFTLILKLSPTLNVKGELRRYKLSRTLEYLGN